MRSTGFSETIRLVGCETFRLGEDDKLFNQKEYRGVTDAGVNYSFQMCPEGGKSTTKITTEDGRIWMTRFPLVEAVSYAGQFVEPDEAKAAMQAVLGKPIFES